MKNVVSLPLVGPRVEDIEALQRVMPECIKAVASEIGVEGIKAFFDGYKTNIDLQKLAA